MISFLQLEWMIDGFIPFLFSVILKIVLNSFQIFLMFIGVQNQDDERLTIRENSEKLPKNTEKEEKLDRAKFFGQVNKNITRHILNLIVSKSYTNKRKNKQNK